VDTGAILLIVLTVVAAVLVVAIGYFAFSRLSGSAHGFPCAYRADESADWERGLLSYKAGRLDHFGRGGPFRGPQHHWQRVALNFGIARTIEGDDLPWLSAPVLAVPCEYVGDRFELALGLEHYTALRAWVESVPPGWNANVA